MKQKAIGSACIIGLLVGATLGCQSGPANWSDVDAQSISDATLAIDKAVADDQGALKAGTFDASEDVNLVSNRSDSVTRKQSIITLRRGETLESYLSGDHSQVLLDFYADWCGPCREQGRILHEVETVAAQTGTLIIKINVDEHPDLAKRLSVSGIPALFMVSGGSVTNQQVGIAKAKLLTSWMQ